MGVIFDPVLGQLRTADVGGGGSGTVTSVSVVTANGVSGSVATATTTPAITLSLGAITPTSINSVVLSGSSTPTLAVTGTSSISGTNTGDQTITLSGAVTGTGTGAITTTFATPGTLTVSSTNSNANAHTHAITSSSAPGAAASLLATDSSGIIGSTGTRIVKGWFTDLTVTNAIAGSITGNAATVTTNANLTGVITSVGNATSIASQTGTGTKFVVDTSPALTGTPTAPTATPATNSTQIATTAYVDNAVLGQNFKEAVGAATTANLVGTYSNGVSGVGATFTYTATGVDTIDGITLTLGMRVLLKNQTTAFQNGLYTVTTAGSVGVAGILTRATDGDQTTDWKTGDSMFVTAGITLSTTTWAYTGIDLPTMGTTSLTFVQTAGQGSFTAGNGIAITGNSIAIDTSVTVDKTTAQALTNKTLTSPVINTSLSGTAFGAGITTWLATPSSANLASAITDETGSGNLVFSASPALTGSPTVPTQSSGDNSTKIASTAYVDRGTSQSLVENEVPAGTINGSNVTFTLASTPATNSLALYINGIRLKPGGADYTLSGGTITMVAAPATGSILLADYNISGSNFSVGTNSIIIGEVPAGLVNSSNTVYTFARSYIAGSVEVFINGLAQARTTNFTETTPASGIITMGTAPLTGDVITVNYQYNLNPASNSDTVDGIHASATPTANQLLALDSNALVPTAALGGAWTTWTPTWTNVTIGNATVTGKYHQIGKTIIYRLHVIWGNTTSISGSAIFSLPVTSILYPGTSTAPVMGSANLFHNGGSVYNGRVVWTSITTATIQVFNASSTYSFSANLSSTVPATWASTDEWHLEGFYEAA